MKKLCKLLTIGLVGLTSQLASAELDPRVPTDENGELILYWCGSTGSQYNGVHAGVGFTQEEAYQTMISNCAAVNSADVSCEVVIGDYVCEEIKFK